MRERVQRFLDELTDFYTVTCKNPEAIDQLVLVGDLVWHVKVKRSGSVGSHFSINRNDSFDEIARKFFNHMITEKLQREMYEEDYKD